MLHLVQDTKDKKSAQAALERNLKSALPPKGNQNIGFPGGNVNQTLFSARDGELWVSFSGPSEDSAVPRFWNAFGVYRPERPSQTITVEINIPAYRNTAQVAGFFARDSDTGDIFVMHSGKVGGGRQGIGKSAFLVWSKAQLLEVAENEGRTRSGIAVGKLGDPDLSGRIWAFVRNVQGFKDDAVSGGLETPDFKRRLEEFDKYSKEFSGKKKGARGGPFEYVTYHGDIVEKLCDDRTSRLRKGEGVSNSALIDLFVKKDGRLSEVYEVKTGLGRQMLYTAIGQLVTHAATGHESVAKFLVIPGDEEIPQDLVQAIKVLGIEIIHFRLDGGVVTLTRPETGSGYGAA